MIETQQPNGQKYSVWEDLVAVCKERDCPPEIITRPEKFKGGVDVVKRSHVLQCLHAKGWREDVLLTLCPLQPSGFYKALRR
jgi:hypothetical protein